ncbi:MAG: hypothetical protein M1833_001335 [Piccolia ochrophora]|nr:MAG: hypothetical protein M1833_001335 [Piccolia ochrophora]
MNQDATETYPLHLTNVPYPTPHPPTSLNNLDICLPRPPSPPFPTKGSKKIWIIYIHGGAWRDPLITSTSFLPTLSHLLKHDSPHLLNIAGFASLNYRLSPYPAHPTSPSSPTDPARNARHPDHIRDVLSAIRYLQAEYKFGSDYALVGHSCGATLAFQVAMRLWEEDGPVELPKAICGVEGIYNVRKLVQRHADVPIYAEIVQGAFGEEESGWATASPSVWAGESSLDDTWEDAEAVVLAHSKADELVEEEQVLEMWNGLRHNTHHKGKRKDDMLYLEGKHDEIWEHGEELVHVIQRALELVLSDL